MTLIVSLAVLSCSLLAASGYPYFSSSGNVDSWSYGDSSRGGMVLSRSYNPYYNRRTVRGQPTTYALRQPKIEHVQQQSSHYHLADKRRQALLEVNDTPPQENEIYYPPVSESFPVIPIETTELLEPVDKTEVAPTTKSVAIPEITEPEVVEVSEEPAQTPKKAINKKKQVEEPVEENTDDEDEEDDRHPNYPQFPNNAFFPMFFGWGGKSGSIGPIAVANAYSTGKSGVATSDATAHGSRRRR